MMQSEVNRMPGIAVVGMGYWGKNLVRNFHQLGALAVVCDSNPAVRDMVAKDYASAAYRASFADVLSDPNVSGVALATPAVSHYEMAKAALEAGKDVFVEKPLAVEVKQGAELVKLAAARGRIIMVGHILQYHPAVLKLRELVRSGALGKIQYVYSNRLNIGKIRNEENILWSFAPHDISVMLGLLGEMPERISSTGGAYLSNNVFDVTVSNFSFPSGVQAHIFVSWLHPVKEQRLVVVGSDKMAVFDDTATDKLVLYPHKVEWKDRIPTAVKADAEAVTLDGGEPLKAECQAFLDSIVSRKPPKTDGNEGLRVLQVLDACQRSLQKHGENVTIDGVAPAASSAPALAYFVHESAYADEGADIGKGTKIWHFSHVMKGAKIGERCIIGQNVNVDGGVTIGSNVKIQNNVSVYTGVVVEDDVFLGPSCVLTNVSNPRSQVNRHSLYEKTLLKRGCSIGANATIVCGVTVGRYAFIGAGTVVNKDVPDYSLMVGNPARKIAWVSRHGQRLSAPDAEGIMRCPESGLRYKETAGVLKCLDLNEEAPLPAEMTKGTKTYRQFKDAKS
jgi:UDP-2-acetamido-3-amino-2,3-dideoxy-glucuronate N-acetyltransferase